MAKPQKKNNYKNKEESKAKKQVVEKSQQKELKKTSGKAVLNNWQDLMEDYSL